jgi:polar amino acid transport system substrate-binding protein
VGPIYYANNTAIWALKNRTIKVENLNDIKKYIVAVSRDDITHAELMARGLRENEHLYVLDNTKSLVNLLLTRPGIDLIVANDMTIRFHTDLAGVTTDDLQRIYEIKNLPLNLFFACSKQTDDNIIKHLSKNLQSLYHDGSYDIILNKWHDQLISPNF